MQPDTLAPLIPIAAIVMFGLVKIARYWGPGVRPQNPAGSRQLEERLEVIEQDLAALQGELAETQERLDFTERMLAQTQEAKRLPHDPSQQ